jgi:hypothetical protein
LKIPKWMIYKHTIVVLGRIYEKAWHCYLLLYSIWILFGVNLLNLRTNMFSMKIMVYIMEHNTSTWQKRYSKNNYVWQLLWKSWYGFKKCLNFYTKSVVQLNIVSTFMRLRCSEKREGLYVHQFHVQHLSDGMSWPFDGIL